MDQEQNQGDRLAKLRNRLGLSQRELAKEFQVSPAAIALWENLERPVPGPVRKLMDVYEHYLDGSDLENSKREIREVSARWTKILLSTIDFRKRKERDWHSEIGQQIEGVLHRELSGEGWKRSIQLGMLSRLVESLGTEKGLPMKVAQLASYVDLGIPQAFREMLTTLQFLSAPMAPAVAARVFYEEIGRAPHEVFKVWSPKPFAAASIGQVHEAILHNGEKVAVKIQYPNIKEALERDFNRLETIQVIGSALQKRDPEIFTEVKKQVLLECDYRREAQSQETFAEYFQGHPTIKIPRVYDEFTRNRVLTQEFINGKSFNELLSTGTYEEQQTAARSISEFYMHGFFLSGLLQLDPHPGNLLFSNGHVAFLDFGRTSKIQPFESQKFRDIWRATIDDDPIRGRTVLESMDVVKDWGRFDFDAFWKLTREVHEMHFEDQVVELTPEFSMKCLHVMQKFPQKREVRSPSAFFWGNMIHLSIWSILGQLHAKLNWRRETEKIVARMPSDGYLSRWDEGL